MTSKLSHNNTRLPMSLFRKALVLFAVCLILLPTLANANIDKSIQRAVERAAQNEAQRNIEDVVKSAVRQQMRRTIDQEVEGLITSEAEAIVARIAGSEIDSRVAAALINTVRIEREQRAIKLDKTSDKGTDMLAKPGDDKGAVITKPGDEKETDIPERPAEQENDLPESDNLSSQTLITSQVERIEQDLAITENLKSDLYGREIWTKEWVIMTDVQTKQKLQQKGYLFSNETYLEIFDQILANVQAPASFNLQKDYQRIKEQADGGELLVDFNHIYRNSESAAPATSQVIGKLPSELMATTEKSFVIGMVDTALNVSHPLLSQASISQSHFLPADAKSISEHGTGVASIMVGQSDIYRGLAPNAQLYNASVFFDVGRKQPIATATDILKGLNWLVKNGANVINMSLSGPSNRLLEFGIQSLCKKGIHVVAAAGNAGPLSEPLFPAGYECAVAVTAVDAERNLYRYAVQGQHIDVAGFGVDVLAASGHDVITPTSGTSIAAPFVTVVIAETLAENQQTFSLPLLLSRSIDLGEPGFDSRFGHGLLLLDKPSVLTASSTSSRKE